MTLRWLVLVACVVGLGDRALADAPPDEQLPTTVEDDTGLAQHAGNDDPSFGPLVTIERIDIIGSGRTAEGIVRGALLVKEGDKLRAGDARFRKSRFRLLALGYFHDAELRLEKGSERGYVVLTVEVWERGSFVLDRIHLGSSQLTTVWGGLDLGDTNLLGSGTTLSAAFVAASAPDVPGGRSQWSARLRWGTPTLGGKPVGLTLVALASQASETVGARGATATAYDYDRMGGVLATTWDPGGPLAFSVEGRLERLDVAVAIPDELPVGEHFLASGAFGVNWDTRSDPVLPLTGQNGFVHVEAGKLGGQPGRFARVEARWQGFLELGTHGRQVLSLAVGGVWAPGDPAGFDRVWLADVDRLAPPRPLDLTVSRGEPFDVLGQAGDDVKSGELGGTVEVEYRMRLFRGGERLYAGDLFIGAGLFALDGDARAGQAGGTLVDLSFDVGLRLDTAIGVFELSLANALGRLPL